MSDLGVELGWYKNKCNCNDYVYLINVYHLTKKFVKIKIYRYFKNHIDLNNIDENYRLHKHEEKYKDKLVRVYRYNLIPDTAIIQPFKKFGREFYLTKEYKISD
jgi:hypothetical protein